jgi:hypothetical protein
MQRPTHKPLKNSGEGVSPMAVPRDYGKEYARFHGKPEEIAKRAKRNAAHASMAKAHGKAALAGKDVHHKNPLRNGGGNGKGNLAIASVHQNRGWEREK